MRHQPRNPRRLRLFALAMTTATVLWHGTSAVWALDDDEKSRKKGQAGADADGGDAKADDEKSADGKSDGKKKQKTHVRWGKRRNETDAQYDKRFKTIVKRTKLDARDEKSGGPVPLWTYKGNPFIVRTDIDAEFTADTAMYMEMLHREYGQAYSLLLQGTKSTIKEKIEVVVFKDQETYLANLGTPGSGGQFMQSIRWPDRGAHWPAQHYRLMQFTDGIDDFSKWDKGTLKHEAAHMELQMRLGLFVDSPRWWNEGHASVFEDWNFDLTVEENLAAIPKRGRYAPFIRRIHGSDRWKDFHYVWTIDGESWHKEMTSDQGFLNYAQAWSLAAYMMGGGVQGRKDFNAIFTLSKRVGSASERANYGIKLRSWDTAFPESDRAEMEKNWTNWVVTNLPKDKLNPDEAYLVKRQGYKPEVTAKLERYSEEEFGKLVDWIQKEEKRRKDRVFK